MISNCFYVAYCFLLITDCSELLSSPLILVGEIGGNDYNDALVAGKSIEQVETYVPLIIEAIVSSINVRIKKVGIPIVISLQS